MSIYRSCIVRYFAAHHIISHKASFNKFFLNLTLSFTSFTLISDLRFLELKKIASESFRDVHVSNDM